MSTEEQRIIDMVSPAKKLAEQMIVMIDGFNVSTGVRIKHISVEWNRAAMPVITMSFEDKPVEFGK